MENLSKQTHTHTGENKKECHKFLERQIYVVANDLKREEVFEQKNNKTNAGKREREKIHISLFKRD